MEGVVATTTQKNLASSQAYGIDLSLSLPQFLLPFKMTTHTHLERLHPMTKLSLAYKMTRHPDYTRDSFASFMCYEWKSQGRGVHAFTPLHIEVIQPRRIEDAFKKYLEEIQLHKTFRSTWLTILSWKSTFCNKPVSDADLSYSLLEFFLESGGVLQNFVDLHKIFPEFTHYQYTKLDISYSQHIPIGSGTVLAYRINTGIAKAYGKDKVLPYDRYYAIGGPNNMRAWNLRSLGPGSYSLPQDVNGKRSLGQLGDIVLQGSVELRQQLVGFLEGALFVDAGNIWTFSDDVYQGGKFGFQKFYKEIAVGIGLGLRLNFKLLVLRFDVGVKCYDPARPVGQRLVRRPLAQQPTFNIGFDYPF